MVRFLVGQEAEMGQELGLSYHPQSLPYQYLLSLDILHIQRFNNIPQTGPPNGEKALKYRSFCKTFLAIL